MPLPTDAQVLAALEKHNYSRAPARAELGVSVDWIRRTVKRMQREGCEIEKDPQTVDGYMPTEEQLLAARDAIKAKWTPEQRAKRDCYGSGSVEVPRVGYDRRREYQHYSETEFSGVNISAG